MFCFGQQEMTAFTYIHSHTTYRTSRFMTWRRKKQKSAHTDAYNRKYVYVCIYIYEKRLIFFCDSQVWTTERPKLRLSIMSADVYIWHIGSTPCNTTRDYGVTYETVWVLWHLPHMLLKTCGLSGVAVMATHLYVYICKPKHPSPHKRVCCHMAHWSAFASSSSSPPACPRWNMRRDMSAHSQRKREHTTYMKCVWLPGTL